ncbi:MAG: hypothetical protein COB42_04420 [Sulfurimonas sp.]|nr:MAG: hypothetical protein COB42_04420 [Sulfurimonas sp.]
MAEIKKKHLFPWGFHLGDLHKGSQIIPLFTSTDDGGFCLLYDKASEAKADNLLQSLCLELLEQMPQESLKVHMFDFGRKKFYNLSPLTAMQLYNNAYNSQLTSKLFDELEAIIVSRYEELLCCNRQTINEHNEKSKLKQMYHLVLINLDVFPPEDLNLKRIQNFVESAQRAGVYIIAFAQEDEEQKRNETTQTILQSFKKLEVKNGEFLITKEIFEFQELLKDHDFKSLDLDKSSLMQKVLTNANLEQFLDPQAIKLESDTKVL